MGHISTSYIDDCLLVADLVESFKSNIYDTVNMSGDAGFVIHPDKSVLQPTQLIVYLGFYLNSKDMTEMLKEKKALKLKGGLCKPFAEKRGNTTRTG